MNTSDLAEKIAGAHDLSKAKAREIVDGILDTITQTVATGAEVSLAGFGKFETRDTAAREGRNPATGATIQIPAGRKVGFSAAKAFKDRIAA